MLQFGFHSEWLDPPIVIHFYIQLMFELGRQLFT